MTKKIIYCIMFTLSEHQNSPTAKDYERSMLGTKSTMQLENRWVFDANYPDDPFANKCAKKMGSIFTQFEGYGVGKLIYGGCGKGRVDVYLNGAKLDHIDTDQTSKIVEFHFSPYTKLELKETDTASVIDLISLEVGPRGNVHHWTV